jgi:hypothetical protein
MSSPANLSGGNLTGGNIPLSGGEVEDLEAGGYAHHYMVKTKKGHYWRRKKYAIARGYKHHTEKYKSSGRSSKRSAMRSAKRSMGKRSAMKKK